MRTMTVDGASEGEEEDTERRDARALDLIDRMLGPLQRYYMRPEFSEIAVVAPRLLFAKRRFGSGPVLQRWEMFHDEALGYNYLIELLTAVAHTYGKRFDPRTKPTLYQMLRGRHRLTAVAGTGVVYDEPVPRGGVSISIRRGFSAEDAPKFTLGSWGLDEHQHTGEIAEGRWTLRRRTTQSAYDVIYDAVHAGTPILFSGATGTGKTSLLNLMLAELHHNLRVITVEDEAQEVIVHNKNRVHLLTPRDLKEMEQSHVIDPRRAIDLIKRSTPDVVLVGEIGTFNAGLAIELMTTGHSHFWTSFHAGSPAEAFEGIASNAMHTLSGSTKEEIVDVLSRTMTVVQTQPGELRPIISHVETPDDRASKPSERPNERRRSQAR